MKPCPRSRAASLGLARFLGLCLTLGALGASRSAAQPAAFRDNDFASFSKGSWEPADLYVTATGAVKSVNRYDLNNDGYLDLVFNSSHDEHRAIEPTCVAVRRGERTFRKLPLPTLGSSRAVVADLNRDGFPDAIVLPNNNGTTVRRPLSIFWGGPDGWSGARRTNLLTMDARAAAVADLNGDGWPDLVVLNGSRWSAADGPESILRVYWGGPDGFSHEKHHDIVVPHSVDLISADLDGDGRPDIAVLTGGADGAILVFWSGPGGLSEPARIALGISDAQRLTLVKAPSASRPSLVANGGGKALLRRDPTTGKEEFQSSQVVFVDPGSAPRAWRGPRQMLTPPCSELIVADLKGDGCPDLVLADRTAPADSVHVLWGDTQGNFDAARVTTFPIGYGSALAVDDIDGDGHPDLVVGTARTADTYQSKSKVLFGDGKGRFREGFEVDTAGVEGVCVTRDDTQARIIFCNEIEGRVHEDLPAMVYWGGPEGFSPERMTKFPIRSGYVCAAADLNDDGYPDLVLMSIVHADAEHHAGVGFNILWGGPDGLKSDRRTILNDYGVYSLCIADVNKDGYLDLVARSNQQTGGLIIWYGGPNGFSREHRQVFGIEGSEGQVLVADFNKDGYPDIAVARNTANLVTIFWGGKEGFSMGNQASIPIVAPADLNAADLNRDGWLDLTVATHKLPDDPEEYDFGSVIFWGSPGGFRQSNSQHLPTHDGLGAVIADFDGDGCLDLFTPSYHRSFTRESIAAELFWGGKEGFSDLNRTDLMQDGSDAGMAADFNGDGKIDLVVACHTRDGSHFTNSLLYLNDGVRFTTTVPLKLPTVGPHYMYRNDVGALYDRTYRKVYTSSVITLGHAFTNGSIEATADCPGKSRLELLVHGAATAKDLESAPWRLCAGGRFEMRATDRFLQYRAILVSDNGDRYPSLKGVVLTVK